MNNSISQITKMDFKKNYKDLDFFYLTSKKKKDDMEKSHCQWKLTVIKQCYLFF